jgi:exoribonuclease R
MRERAGKKVLPGTLKKLATMDKWVTYEILDYLHDTDKNDDDIPFVAEDVLDDLEKGDKSTSPSTEEKQVDQVGLRIDQELDKLYATGKTSFEIDEIRSSARNTYKEIWDNYEEGEQNGIMTSKYSLLESGDYTFNLKLK